MKSYVGRGIGAHFINDLFMAQKYIYSASRWISPEYAERLVSKAREGVEVKVITSNDDEKSHQEAIKVLTSALKPPKMFLLRKSDWIPPNMEVGIIKEEYLHVKMYVFDNMAVVGSANFTERGLWENIEHVVIFDKPDEVEQIKKDFITLWKLYTEEKRIVEEVITLEDIAKKIGKSIQEFLSIFARRKHQ